jgi:tRNA dimethylallyltransferase
MLPEPFQNALVLTGPTGSGKTELAVELAEQLGAEIVAMDSMTLYRGMDIGTAKPGPEERRRVPHHLLDVVDPWESASVAWWLEQAAACCRAIEGRGKRVLFVGGTPLYLKALVHGLFEGPPAHPALRQRLLEEAERDGKPALHARLAAVDPAAAARLHPNDVRRVVRALEVWHLTGRPISEWQNEWPRAGRPRSGSEGQAVPGTRFTVPSPDLSAPSTQHPLPGSPSSVLHTAYSVPATAYSPVLCLDLSRDELYARINARVERMFAAGLVDEVRALRGLPRRLSREAAQALGYKETVEYLDGRATLADTVVRIQTRSRNFAKRQMTWFRHLPGLRPVSRELTFAAWGLTMDR